MQEEALLKAQQIVYNKNSYQKKQIDQHSQGSYQQVKKPNRSRQKKNNNSNISGLLSFKIESKEQLPSKFIKSLPQTISDITLSPYFRFAVIVNDYNSYHSNPNLQIP